MLAAQMGVNIGATGLSSEQLSAAGRARAPRRGGHGHGSWHGPEHGDDARHGGFHTKWRVSWTACVWGLGSTDEFYGSVLIKPIWKSWLKFRTLKLVVGTRLIIYFWASNS